MRVGIYCTYSRSEETAAAIHLASTLHKLGAEISWLAPLGAVSGVHADWDQRISTVDLLPPSRWIRDLDSIVWFRANVEASALARLSGKQGHKQFRVMAHVSLSDPAEFARFDRVVIPDTHPDVLEELRQFLGRYDLAARVVSCPWTTGITCPIKASAKTNDRARTVLVYCDGRAWRRDGHLVIDMARQLLIAPAMINWNLCLGFDDAADGGAEPLLNRARASANGRLKIESRPGLDKVLELIRNADRLVLPAYHQDWSLFGRWAEMYGTPALSWYAIATGQTTKLDASFPGASEIPFNENIMCDAILKSCTIHTSRTPAPPEDSARFIEFWKKLLTDR